MYIVNFVMLYLNSSINKNVLRTYQLSDKCDRDGDNKTSPTPM